MNDQAARLRNLIRTQDGSNDENTTKVITVTSGKGGVGKSNFTLNFALALQNHGYRTLIFDADIGFANIDVLMGIHPPYTMYHLLNKEKTIQEIIYKGHQNVQFIAGGSGFNNIPRLTSEELDYFVSQIEQLNGYVDFILFDTGAGLSQETLKFIVSAHETILVTTPEPTSITDAYAIIKMIHSLGHTLNYHLVINRAMDSKEGKFTADKISMVAEQFLGLNIPVLGYVPDDVNVTKAVKQQVPFTIAYPNTQAAKGLNEITMNFLSAQKKSVLTKETGVRSFLNKMIKLLK